MEYFEPTFLLQDLDDVQRIVFVGKLLYFMSKGTMANVIDVVIFPS